jgi:PAS domain S-box-containing protein
MIKEERYGNIMERGTTGWMLSAATILGIGLPLGVTLVFISLLPTWSWLSLPIHSTLEVVGAVLGLVLAVIILFSQQKTQTTRRMWIACALISMGVLDIAHSCVPVGNSFVWLHSLAVLAGGIFFALVWFPESIVSRGTAWSASGAVLLVSILIGLFSGLYPQSVPTMILQGSFTPLADAINLIGGGLTLLAALNFGIRYYRERNMEEMIFLLLCLFFGGPGVLFQLSVAWGAGWWFWHVLRFAAYLFAFWLAMLSYRSSEDKMLHAQKELDGLFHTSIDGKRLVDRNFNQLRINDRFLNMTGLNRERAEKMKCYEAFSGELCHTEECPIKQLWTGKQNKIYQEIVKVSKNGKKITCLLNAVKVNAADGSFMGIIESFWDITDRKAAEQKLEEQNVLQTGQTDLSDVMRKDVETDSLCMNILNFMAKYLQAQVGAFYLNNGNNVFTLRASYAYKTRKNLSNEFAIGEGLVGQAALEKQPIMLSQVPDDYITVTSGLGSKPPRNILVQPLVFNNTSLGVIEIGSLEAFSEAQRFFIEVSGERIAIAIQTATAREQLKKSLEKTQQQAEELQSQQEELRVTNEELEEQTQALEKSEQKLKAQQEELEVANEELREKNESLQQQKREIEKTRKAIQEKAEELAIAGKYKSEFLANMSHELRTPLNSLLLLASILSENKEGNLTQDQIASTRIIYQSGNDLLSLINEILDLAKIESGRLVLQSEEILIKDIADSLAANFQHMIDDKGLRLAINISENVPAAIQVDRKRVEQIMKNLMSNAIKFTEKGSVTVDFSRPVKNADLSRSGLDRKNTIAIAVEDTGIGISPEDQKIVFEAFQQAEGGTARQYGGTGLGLSISRELARLLGGEIQLISEKGKGSVFTIYLPIEPKAEGAKHFKPAPGTHKAEPVGRFADMQQKIPVAEPIADDRDSIAEDEKVILVIEDDPKFARLLLKLCHERGLKCLATPLGEEGLLLAEKHLPEAIILDIKLPGVDGWTVLETLKENPKVRHIPVHMMSVEESTLEAFRKGAIGYLKKPVNKEDLDAAFHKLVDVFSKEVKNLLVVEDDKNLRKSIIKLMGNGDVSAEEAANGAETIQALKSKTFDCMILDLGLPDMTGFELLRALEAQENITIPPVIIYTGRELTQEEDAQLRNYAESIIIKGVKSEERLLDEASLFLHRVVSKMPEKKRQMITSLHDTDVMFKDKTVLVVDDDMRNVYSLSKVLKEKGMRVLKAENGQKALDVLKTTSAVDLVLMDIMMPVMDGYETMKRIRAQERFRKLPVIALTAKAMKEDETRCIAAGASDYLPKPVDVNRLSSMMRVWLYR